MSLEAFVWGYTSRFFTHSVQAGQSLSGISFTLSIPLLCELMTFCRVWHVISLLIRYVIIVHSKNVFLASDPFLVSTYFRAQCEP